MREPPAAFARTACLSRTPSMTRSEHAARKRCASALGVNRSQAKTAAGGLVPTHEHCGWVAHAQFPRTAAWQRRGGLRQRLDRLAKARPCARSSGDAVALATLSQRVRFSVSTVIRACSHAHSSRTRQPAVGGRPRRTGRSRLDDHGNASSGGGGSENLAPTLRVGDRIGPLANST